jgi:hypothetical protein
MKNPPELSGAGLRHLLWCLQHRCEGCACRALMSTIDANGARRDDCCNDKDAGGRSSLQPHLKLVREEPANDNVAERWTPWARLWVFVSFSLGLWLLVDLITDIVVR